MLSESFISQIKAYCTSRPIELVYLFGSYAAGTENSRSDVDFGVLFDPGLSALERGKQKEDIIHFLIGLLHQDQVDVIDLSLAPLALKYEVLKARKDIYVKSETLRVDFETKVLSEYFDYRYYMKRHSRMSISQFAGNGLN